MKRKSEPDDGLKAAIREMASVLRRHRLNALQASYVLRKAREEVGVEPYRPAKRLPRNLTDAELEAFFRAVETEGPSEHLLLYKLLFYTGCRVSEIVNARREHLDLTACTLRVVAGKGNKDRVVLFPESLRLPLRLHLDATADQVFLFESRRRQRLSTRWIQVLAARYGKAAGIEEMHPHRLRHTLLTELSRAGLSDSQIQQVSGHASKRALAVYQHLALGDVAEDYQRVVGRREP